MDYDVVVDTPDQNTMMSDIIASSSTRTKKGSELPSGTHRGSNVRLLPSIIDLIMTNDSL